MTSRAAVLAGILLTSLGAALISGKEIFFNLTYAWAGLLLLSFLWSRLALAGVSLEREARSTRTQVGHILEERLSLVNRSLLPKLWIEVEDHSDLKEHRASTVCTWLRARHERTWAARTLCLRRGSYRLGPATIRSGDPFGLFPVIREGAKTERVVVLPQTARLSRFTLPSGHRPGGEALRHRTHQVTPSAAGVRDYAPGDGLNRIHWPSTARRRRLIAKEFELDPKADVWIFVDAAYEAQLALASPRETGIQPWTSPHAVALPDSTEEYLVACAASVAAHLAEQDRAVGLVSYASRRLAIQPDRGRKQLDRILETLAVLKCEGALSLEEVLKVESVQVPRGASVILVTAASQPTLLTLARQLERRGLLPILILLEARSFGGREGAQALAAAAQRAGLGVKLVARGDDLGAALSGLHLGRPLARVA